MEESQPQGLRASLTAGEQHWAWKLGFRIALLVLDIIGIGCVGYATAASVNLSTWWIDSWAIPWGLITLTISFLWCFVCIVVLLARKRPVHPGAIVGVDLILWLSFLVTALFALAGLFSIISFGDAGYISDYSSSSGGYYLASNNTWVWNSTSSYYYSSSSSSRSCSNYGFSSCAEQDDMVNRLWQERGTLVATEATGVAMQFLGLLGHFILFVWGCVDCHRRRSQKTSKQAEEIARKIIEDMTRRGQIVPAQQQMAMPLLGHAAVAGGREMTRNGESEASRTASMSGALGEQSGNQQMKQLSPLPTQHAHTSTLPQGHTAPSHRSISPIEANDDAITPQPQAHPQPPHQQPSA